MGYVPKKGDIIWIDFSPQRGHEQAGQRPALVVSPDAYNKRSGFVVCCPITSKVKNFRFEVPVETEFGIKGVVLSDHIKSMDWVSRKPRYAGKASREVLDDVVTRIVSLLDPE